MRVLHVLHTSLPYICGYSIRSDYILRNQQPLCIEAAAVTSAQHPNGSEAVEEIAGLRYWRTTATPAPPIPFARELRQMRALRLRTREAARTWRAEVIHAHSPMLVGTPAMAVARELGIPFIYEIRDLWENASVDRGKFAQGSLQYRAAQRMETRVLRRADAVVTICRSLADELAPRVGSADRLHVVDNGVDAAGLNPAADGAPVRERFGLTGKLVVGYVGTFQPYEGLNLLIDAIGIVSRTLPSAHLLIVGSGGEEDRLRAHTAAAGLAERITFTGRLPHSEVEGAYAAADVLVYPRILTRTTALTTPLKPLEAMAMRKAVLVSDVPAMRELVEPGVTGAAFRAGDVDDLAGQCLRLLQCPEERDAIGRRARDWVLAERQWPRLVARYTDIYARACERRRT